MSTVNYTRVIASSNSNDPLSNNLRTLLMDYNNSIRNDVEHDLTPQDFDLWVETNNPSVANNALFSIETGVNSWLQDNNYGTIDFEHYLEVETGGRKNVYLFQTTNGEIVRFNLDDETVEILSDRDFKNQLDMLDNTGANNLSELNGSVTPKLEGKTVKFERDKIVLEDVNVSDLKTGLTFNDASKPFAGSISYVDGADLYKKAFTDNRGNTKNPVVELKNAVEDKIARSLGLTKPDPSNAEAVYQYEIDMLEGITGKKFATDGEDYMKNYREQVFNGFIDTVASEIIKAHDQGLGENPDGQLHIRSGDLNGITFDEQKLMLKHPELKDASGAHVDIWDAMTTEKAHKPEFVNYVNNMFDPVGRGIEANDITVDAGEIKINSTSFGTETMSIQDATLAGTSMTSQQIENYYNNGVTTGLSSNQINYLNNNRNNTSLYTVQENLSGDNKKNDGIDYTNRVYKGLTFTAPPAPAVWEPMGFTAKDGTRFDFVEDENGNGVFDGKEEFVGFDDYWADMVKYDTDGNGMIEGSELDKLMVLVSNTNGTSHITSARAAGLTEINLGSRKEINEFKEDGNYLLSEYELKFKGDKYIGEQTLDTDEFLKKNYSDNFGINLF